jgi:hypothetical protein
MRRDQLKILRQGQTNRQTHGLESELDRTLKDAGSLGAGDSAEAAGSPVHVCTWVVEVGMIEHVESLKSQSHRQSFMQREAAA